MSDESTYSLYDQIPPLPVPTLEDTAQRYLASVAPLVDSATYAEVEAAMNAFTAPGGQGPRLQAALEQRAASSDNWLAEWWDDVAYLAYPEPVLINSNWGIWCDPRQPTDDPAMRAAEIAARGGGRRRDVVLLSDGGGIGAEAIHEARLLRESGARVSAIFVPPVREPYGMPPSQRDALERLVDTGDGELADAGDVRRLATVLVAPPSAAVERAFVAVTYDDHGRAILVLALIPMLLLFRRRG